MCLLIRSGTKIRQCRNSSRLKEWKGKCYSDINKIEQIVNKTINRAFSDAKRAEVLYHAQRGIAELNYDTLGNNLILNRFKPIVLINSKSRLE